MDITDNVKNIVSSLSDEEKIQVLYEIGYEIVGISEDEYEKLENNERTFVEDVANILNDINNNDINK